jgi:hypothetical protein
MTYTRGSPRGRVVQISTSHASEFWSDFKDNSTKWIPHLAKEGVPIDVTVRRHVSEYGNVYFSNPMLFGTVTHVYTKEKYGFLICESLNTRLYFKFANCDEGVLDVLNTKYRNRPKMWFRVAMVADATGLRFWATRVGVATLC